MECSAEKMFPTTSLITSSVTQSTNSEQDIYKSPKKGDVIHSGHFMVSSVADDGDEHEEINHDRDSPVHHEQAIMIRGHGYDFSNVNKETKNIYQFGPSHSNHITIDSSLSRLFKCMSLAYRGGKVVSPKWKNFKGLKLTVKDKIRLNNAIWRTWHIQYVMHRKKPSLIQFATPLEADLECDLHNRPEAVVMEGKYWKRRIETVVAEYKKWRAFFMEKLRLSEYPGLTWVSDIQNSPSSDHNLESHRRFEEQNATDFTDTLFSSLSNQPFQFPNPREIAMHATNSDMMQPGLLQLQPMMDDMDFDPLQDFFAPPKKSNTGFGTGLHHNDRIAEEGFISHGINQMIDASHIEPIQQSNEIAMQYAPHPQLKVTTHSDPIFSAFNITQYSGLNVDVAHATNINQHQTIDPTFKQYPSQNMGVPKQNNMGNNQSQQTMRYTSQEQPGFSKISQNNLPNNRIIYTQPQTSLQMEVLQTPAHHIGSTLVENNPNQYATIRPMQNINETYNQQQTVSNNTVQWMPSNNDPNISAMEQQQFVAELNNTAMSLQNQLKSGSSVTPTKVHGMDLLKHLLSTKPHGNGQSLPMTNAPVQTAKKPQYKRVANVVKDHPSSHHGNQAITPYVTPNKPEFKPQQSLSQPDVEIEFRKSGLNEMLAEQTTTDVATPLQDPIINRTNLISAEQKRRFNIKVGFTRLQSLIPGLTSQTVSKVSKATIMSKAAQYIKTMQNERLKMSEEIQGLKKEVDVLKSAISECQQKLPATGVPVARPPLDVAKSKFERWVRERTKRDWKFYLFGLVINPWFDSYQQMVSVTGSEDLCRSVLEWVDQKCSLPALRPNVVQSLQVLGTTTSILTNPANLRQQIEDRVNSDDNTRTRYLI
uniref:transcription factor protein isoform X1 n=1 Tax=Ciona intestinalis TaxID=7719 RepID=UPI00052121AE|nr:transcription factor protein isoform X1 [Ciona intestinalis]|eukprot:XP_009860089.1 transcription factor protein isoform X1 [Ciona intestinalis]